MSLLHNTIFSNESKIAKRLPLTQPMQAFHPGGSFPLLFDPIREEKTIIIGMFVMRPARERWVAPILSEGRCSVYDVADWCYNIRDMIGVGGVIANGNLLDGYRLTMQYGLSDAVLVGSNNVLFESTPRPDGSPPYIWQPYFTAAWPHLKQAIPNLMEIIQDARKSWQQLGYLSPSREYPANIVVSQSGKETTPDLLEGRIFHDTLPNGKPMEAYIVTCESGAEKIRARAHRYGLADRIDDILMVLSDPADPTKIDLKALPEHTYKKYGMRMINHDGGALVMEAFSQAGILPQCNFTFGRQTSTYEALSNNSYLNKSLKESALAQFDERVERFFKSSPLGQLPPECRIVEITVDDVDEAAVMVLDVRDLVKY
jgi:hypothetical protein